MKEERYWIRVNTLPWQEATREQFMKAEKTAGFLSATGDFYGGGIEGKITYSEITEKDYSEDPEFLKVAMAPKK